MFCVNDFVAGEGERDEMFLRCTLLRPCVHMIVHVRMMMSMQMILEVMNIVVLSVFV